MTTSEIERIIPPEIKNDEFYALIAHLSATEKLKYVLEIGSSAGAGSTEAFIRGLQANPDKPFMFCIEVSKPRFEVLKARYAPLPFVKCYNMSSVALHEFPPNSEIETFYREQNSALRNYPLPTVMGWLDADRHYVGSSDVPTNAIDAIKADYGISNEDLDLVLIDGSEFTGEVELRKILGARIILLDDTNSFKCFKARQLLLNHPDYEIFADNQQLRNGFSAFRRKAAQVDGLPVHFFTIVLNGEPWIRYHEKVLSQLPFKWHWHIIEGVASLSHDTAWSLQTGGRIESGIHRDGRSNDGTSEYLDDLVRRFPANITVYRKPPGVFWDGKREMVNAPLSNIKEECLLWQVDADELWTMAQINTVRLRFMSEPDRTAAFYWCWFFVGHNKVISTRYNYGQNPKFEWLRTWRLRPGDFWAAHEPPTLVRPQANSNSIDLASVCPFLHDETEEMGAVFQHYAYATEEQVRFKESYYGYAGAVAAWRSLQSDQGPGPLAQYLGWVKDHTLFDSAEFLGLEQLARKDLHTGKWTFDPHASSKNIQRSTSSSCIVIDGICWQYAHLSINNMWKEFLEAWVQNGSSQRIIVLDRAGTAPRIKGVHYLTIAARDPDKTGADSLRLEKICREVGATLFVSTFYTTPTDTPSFFIGYDPVSEAPEISSSKNPGSEVAWAMKHASGHGLFSIRTADELRQTNSGLSQVLFSIVPFGVTKHFRLFSADEIARGRTAIGLPDKYVVMSGGRLHADRVAKSEILLSSLELLNKTEENLALICVGGAPELEPELRSIAPNVKVYRLTDQHEALPLIYAAAHAFVYSGSSVDSGAAVLDAMACGCPVLVQQETSAVDASRFAEMLAQLFNPEVRAAYVKNSAPQDREFAATNQAMQIMALVEGCLKDLVSGNGRKPGSGWDALRSYQASHQ